MHSTLTVVYQLCESENQLGAIPWFLWLLFYLEKKKNFDSPFQVLGPKQLSMMRRQPFGLAHVYSTSLPWQLAMRGWLVPGHPRMMFFCDHRAGEWLHCPILSSDYWGKWRPRKVTVTQLVAELELDTSSPEPKCHSHYFSTFNCYP